MMSPSAGYDFDSDSDFDTDGKKPTIISEMHTSTHTIKGGQELLVREATPEDSRRLIEFVEEASGESDYLSFGPGEFGISEDEEQTIVADFLKADANIYLIAVLDDQIVGSLTFTSGKRKRLSHSGEFGMCVRKKFWRFGIGGILVDVLIGWAENQGTIQKINLCVRCDNLSAIQLYLKKGFQIEGRILDAMRIGERSFDTYCMGLSLNL